MIMAIIFRAGRQAVPMKTATDLWRSGISSLCNMKSMAAANRSIFPNRPIDTGMGLERIAAVLQGVHDNYDVDLFRTLIAASVDLTGRKAEGDDKPAHRVIADHLRASSFLMADGVAPSNEGRGYVLRRIMRRAMRYAHGLGARDPLLAQLAPVLVQEMGAAFPELVRAEPLIIETLRSEGRKIPQSSGPRSEAPEAGSFRSQR